MSARPRLPSADRVARVLAERGVTSRVAPEVVDDPVVADAFAECRVFWVHIDRRGLPRPTDQGSTAMFALAPSGRPFPLSAEPAGAERLLSLAGASALVDASALAKVLLEAACPSGRAHVLVESLEEWLAGDAAAFELEREALSTYRERVGGPLLEGGPRGGWQLRCASLFGKGSRRPTHVFAWRFEITPKLRVSSASERLPGLSVGPW